MARTDAIVLGAGIVGISVALQLAKRGLSVALVDRARRRRGNLLRQFRRDRGRHDLSAGVSARARWRCCGSRFKRAPRGQLSSVVPAAGRAMAHRVSRRVAARTHRRNGAADAPAVCARAVAEHETLMEEAGAHALSAQDRLDEDLPPRSDLRRRWRRSSSWRASSAFRCEPLDARRRARARAVARIRCSSTRCSGRRRRASAIRWR